MEIYKLYTVTQTGFASLVTAFFSAEEEDALAKASIFAEEHDLTNATLENETTGQIWEYSDEWELI